jgi:CheY-like chemotaxis protein
LRGWGGAVLENCRILIVEDEPVVALELASILEEERAKVVGVADSVASALNFLQRDNINCAILDIDIRGESSWPIADVLSNRHIPFAFISGLSEILLPTRHIGRPIIRKPFATAEVIEVVAVMAWR